MGTIARTYRKPPRIAGAIYDMIAIFVAAGPCNGRCLLTVIWVQMNIMFSLVTDAVHRTTIKM